MESALAQTYSHVEVIVVDDGSTDGSVRVLESFDERIKFEAAPNRGACAARNRALAMSRGEFIQFLDADDVLLPEKIERQLPFLISGQADLVFCKGYIFGDGRPARPKKRPILSPVGQDPFAYCLKQGLSTEGPLHRRNCVERISGFREGLPRAQEFDFHIRLAASGVRLHLLEEWLYWHREHDGLRITRTPQLPDHMVKFMLELADVLEGCDLYEMSGSRRAALAGIIFEHAIYAYRNGAEATAKIAFEHAQNLSRHFDYPERGWYQSLARVCGPVAAEELLKWGRRGRRKFAPMSLSDAVTTSNVKEQSN